MTPLCVPHLLPEGGTGDMAAFLAAHDLIHVAIEGRPASYSWEIFARMSGCPALDVKRGVVFDTAQLALEYALTGKGIIVSDPILFAREIEAGRLARPFDVAVPDGYGYYLAVSAEDLENPVVSAFRSWLLARFGAAASGASA
jgi:DNA-binding transcriptional LysR family regulator